LGRAAEQFVRRVSGHEYIIVVVAVFDMYRHVKMDTEATAEEKRSRRGGRGGRGGGARG
jgi:hypothetical protein